MHCPLLYVLYTAELAHVVSQHETVTLYQHDRDDATDTVAKLRVW